MVKIAVLGHGVVGSGVVEVLDKNSANIQRKAGREIEIKYILDLRDFSDSPYSEKFVKDFAQIVNDPEIKVVVEAIGGLGAAYQFVKSSLLAGKSVVTSNKELVAQKGAELLALAAQHNVNFLFEASVGGGIPIIRPLHQCLAASEIDEIAGILNGTTNFILTRMIKENMPFADALAQAQRLGYAEANPAADIEGTDTCRKICILASLAFGRHVYPEYVHTSGISDITQADLEYAASSGYVIKLIGQARRMEGGQVYAMVGPAFIRKDSQLAGIDDEFNGILVRADATGDVVFYGKGAGKLPTASAVMSDVIDCIRAESTIASLSWADSAGRNVVVDYKTQPAAMYVRCLGDAAAIAENFGEVQGLSRKKQPKGETAFLAAPMPEGELLEKLGALRMRGIEVLGAIRVLDY